MTSDVIMSNIANRCPAAAPILADSLMGITVPDDTSLPE